MLDVQVAKLMAKVEDIFTKHFSDHDRRKAMAQLRPLQQRGGHSVTFFLGTYYMTTTVLWDIEILKEITDAFCPLYWFLDKA